MNGNGLLNGQAVADRMRQRRRELGLSQDAAAQRAGVSLRGWQKWESGRPPSARLLGAVTDALAMPVDLLLYGAEEDHPGTLASRVAELESRVESLERRRFWRRRR